MANRLLDDQAGAGALLSSTPRVGRHDESCVRQAQDGGFDHRRGQGEIVDAVALEAAVVLDGVEPRAERCEAGRVRQVDGHEREARSEGGPSHVVDRAA